VATSSRVRRGADEPWIDASGDIWQAGFPGLGTVSVAPDGSTVVSPEPIGAADDPAVSAQRERALQFGWAEPLSFTRRGYSSVLGVAFEMPAPDRAVLFTGAPGEDSALVAEFGRRGWPMLSEGLVPVRLHGDRLLAHSRRAPALAAHRRLDDEGLTGTRVRSQSDACEVPVARAIGTRQVAAVVAFSTRKVGDTRFEVLRGQSRFQAAARLLSRGMLTAATETDSEPQPLLSTHLLLAALPFARLRFARGTVAADVAEVVEWLGDS
jgi:hypothetical protein